MPDTPMEKARPHPFRARNLDSSPRCHEPACDTAYAELAVTSNFTFLTGASHPEELVQRAAELGHTCAAIADTNTLAGIVRAHVAAKDAGIPLAVGSRLVFEDGLSVLVFSTDRSAYARLCNLLTLGKRRAPKGECYLALHDLLEYQEGLLAIALAPSVIDDHFIECLRGLQGVFDDDRLSLAVAFGYRGNDADRLAQLDVLGHETGVRLVATNDVLYHAPERRPLQDVVTCIRHGCTIEQGGFRLQANAERHLKPPAEMTRLFAEYPRAIARSVEIARRASAFSLDELRYEYPVEPCPPGMSPTAYLEQEAMAGAQKRYPEGVPEKTLASLKRELELIEELKYEAYFLTCYDIVTFARSQGILCQGRGGAANSAVCYCLGITEVDPAKNSLLFERFVSRERAEPPDIDIDFEHERREAVIQYIYGKYGRDRAALTAEVISYRGRSAVREVGKAMGLPEDCVDALAKNLDRWGEAASSERVQELGLNPDDPTLQHVIELTQELVGFPRHLSQHVGGFVITHSSLHDLVPIENAAMEDRTVIEWDKDDIDALGMLKVDCLGLGMLTCIRKALELLVEEETKRRRDEETKCCEKDIEGGSRGWCKDVQGSCGVAEGDGACQADLSGNAEYAGGGTIRFDKSDASGRRICAFEHCGRLWERESAGSGQVLAHSTRVSQRDHDPVRTGHASWDAATLKADRRTRGGDRPRPAGAHTEPQGQSGLKPLATSSLRLSVSSSLYSLYAHIANNPTDPSVYDMVCHADTVGVFQIESRAQMSMLPRLRPQEFYDLVIEVAIVRPGPIQGGMVHPYLRRRDRTEPVAYPTPEVEDVLSRTLGVPLFQEQAMQLAIVAAGFTPDQADGLRRSMAAWKRKGNAIYRYGEQLIEGMLANGYSREFAERCFEQIKGFSEYGFPESHAASFAILVYVSAWLKRHHPAAFAAALINSQPMGFYAPAQIIRDAKEHGVEVREVDVNTSGWGCALEGREAEVGEGDQETERQTYGVGWGGSGPALRLGMRLVNGLAEVDAERIASAVDRCGQFFTIESLWRASGVSTRALRCLARADAFRSMGLDRQQALWQIKPLRDEPLPLFAPMDTTSDAGLDNLPVIAPHRAVLSDYESTGLSLKAHPVSFIRDELEKRRVVQASELRSERLCPQGRKLAVAGLVLCRQRPGTASGVVFITLEDETGIANLIVWSDTFERYRRVARLSTILIARGAIERQGEVVHLHVKSLESGDELLPTLTSISRDFH